MFKLFLSIECSGSGAAFLLALLGVLLTTAFGMGWLPPMTCHESDMDSR